jgi:hypothetical protein
LCLQGISSHDIYRLLLDGITRSATRQDDAWLALGSLRHLLPLPNALAISPEQVLQLAVKLTVKRCTALKKWTLPHFGEGLLLDELNRCGLSLACGVCLTCTVWQPDGACVEPLAVASWFSCRVLTAQHAVLLSCLLCVPVGVCAINMAVVCCCRLLKHAVVTPMVVRKMAEDLLSIPGALFGLLERMTEVSLNTILGQQDIQLLLELAVSLR